MYRYATQPELPSPIRHGEPCLRVAFAVGPSSPRTPAPDNLFLPTPSESECWKRRNHHANARRMEKEDATCIRIVHVRTSKRAHPNDPRTGICSPILRSAYEQKSQTELEIRCRRSLIWRPAPNNGRRQPSDRTEEHDSFDCSAAFAVPRTPIQFRMANVQTDQRDPLRHIQNHGVIQSTTDSWKRRR